MIAGVFANHQPLFGIPLPVILAGIVVGLILFVALRRKGL